MRALFDTSPCSDPEERVLRDERAWDGAKLVALFLCDLALIRSIAFRYEGE